MFPCQENPARPCCPSPLHLSEIGRMLEMVTSGSFSSIRSIPQVASVSQREPKLSPKEKGLSLYLVRQHRSLENLDEEHGGQVCTPTTALLWGSRGESTNVIKQVELRAGGLRAHRGFLLDHLHLRQHRVRHGAVETSRAARERL